MFIFKGKNGQNYLTPEDAEKYGDGLIARQEKIEPKWEPYTWEKYQAEIKALQEPIQEQTNN